MMRREEEEEEKDSEDKKWKSQPFTCKCLTVST